MEVQQVEVEEDWRVWHGFVRDAQELRHWT